MPINNDEGVGPDFPPPHELKKSYEEIERELIKDIEDKVFKGQSIKEILDTVFDSFSDILSYDRLALAFLEEEGKRVVCKYVKTKYNPVYLNEGYSLDLYKTSLEKVLLTKSPRIINNLNNYFLIRRNSFTTELLIREGLKSSMITPLFANEKPLGFIFFNSTYPNAYSERELRILNELKNKISFAIEKAFYIEELQKTLESYKELLNFVSHEIKNPLSALITQGRLLEGGFLGELTNEQKEVISKMVSKAEYLLNLVRNYLDLSRIERGVIKVTKEEVDIEEKVINEAITIMLPQIEAKKMVFEKRVVGERYKLFIDPQLIKVAIVNLLGNGVQYGKEGGKIELEINYKQDGLFISVLNEGEGFTEEQKSKLFKKFSRLDVTKSLGIKGTGLGLYITWWIITEHKGWIDAVSEVGKYAKFFFFLPKEV